jgi:hypothetical protein
MPDINGLPTVRECELEIEITRLKRENSQLQCQSRDFPNRVPLVNEKELEVSSITPTLQIASLVTSVHENYCTRITAECFLSEEAYKIADYISDDLLAQSFDPLQSMMALYLRTLKRVAARS